MAGDDWRVEIELDDEEHGFSLGERLRSLDLDDEVRQRLGGRVIVTRDGSRLFLYTRTRAEADEAARVARAVVAEERLTAEVRATRWRPETEAWEPEAEREEPGWRVHVHAPDRESAAAIADRLGREGIPVERRWTFLTAAARTEDEARALADRLAAELPDAEVEVDATAGVPDPLFVLIRSWL